jgi:glycosyltransferase involved in cell wall biosynthesis
MTNGDVPCVSVVIATRNRPAYLARALNSVAAQTLRNIEVILVDDGSDREVQEEYDKILGQFDKRFKLLKPSAPGASGTGPATARNRGLKSARGEFAAFLDDDDYWLLSDHLESAARALRRQKADYYFSKIWCDRNGHYPMAWEPDPRILCQGTKVCDSPAIYDVPRSVLAGLMKKCLVHLNVTIVRRSILEEIGGFQEGSRFLEDMNLMIRIADHAQRVLFRPEYAAWYQLPRGNSVSLSQTNFEQKVQALLSAQHARFSCRDSMIRNTARAREGWVLRELSAAEMTQGASAEAVRLAWQALGVYGSAGTAAFFARQAAQAVLSSFTQKGRK